jgi:hypothetical protein
MGLSGRTRFELHESSGEDPYVAGHLAVTSAQPYENNARVDCLRAARDLCNILSITAGGSMPFEPVGPQARASDRRQGRARRREHRNVGLGHNQHEPQARRPRRLPAARGGAGRGEPSLRADLDTWRQATLESDGPARFITYYRIYEAEAAALLAEEPRLLSDDPVERCLHALPDGLGRDERERLQNSVGDALRKVRARSRPQVLAETVGAAKPGGATGRMSAAAIRPAVGR